jgi:hypothetical protein
MHLSEVLCNGFMDVARRIVIPTTKKGWMIFIICIVAYVAAYMGVGVIKKDISEKSRSTVALIVTVVAVIIGLIAFD